MPNQQSKRTARGAGMNQDLNRRLIPEGSYRDGVNINVSRSEGDDVGAIENLPGNERVGTQAVSGEVIGQVRDGNKIYWFVENGTSGDAIYEYDVDTDTVSPVLLDGFEVRPDTGGPVVPDDFTANYVLDSTGITNPPNEAGQNFEFTQPAAMTGDAGDTYTFEDPTLTANPGFEFSVDPTFAGDSLTGTFVDANVTVNRTVTGTLIRMARAFTFDDAGVMFSVSNPGQVSLTATLGTIASATFVNNQQLGAVTENTVRTNTVVINVPNIPAAYTNAGETVMGTVTFTQSFSPTLTFDDLGVTCSVNINGTVSVAATIGTASLGTGQVASYGTVDVDTPRVISVAVTGTTPSTFAEPGSTFNLTGTCPTTQPLFRLPTFGFGNTGSTASIDTQTGDVTIRTGPGYTITLAAGQPSTYGTVTTPITRTIRVVVTGTTPGGFQNAGNPFSVTGSINALQGAVTQGAFTEANWTGSVSVTPLGAVLENNGNVGSVTTVPTSFPFNNTDDDIPRTLSVTLRNIPPGFSNSGGNITFSRTVQQPSNLPVFTEPDWSGVVTVTQGGAVQATVGNAGPITIITRTVDANNTPNAITRSITVDVTIPAGFQNFGRTFRLIRGASQPGAATQMFTNTITIAGDVSNARISSRTVTITAAAGGQGRNTTVVISPNTGFEFTSRANVSVSSSNNTLASAVETLDQFGNIFLTISSTVGSMNQNVTLTVSGAAVAAQVFDAGNIIRDGGTGSQITVGSFTTFRVSPTGGTGNYTYAWAFNGFGARITGSTTQRTVQVEGTNNGGGGQLTVTVRDGALSDSAAFTLAVSDESGGGPV